MVSSRDRGGVETQDYMINWNVGPLGLVLRPDLGADMPPVVAQVLPGESVASLAGVGVGDMLVSVNGKKCSKMGYEKAMKTLYKHKLPIILHFRIPQFKTLAAQDASGNQAAQSYHHHANGNANGNGNGNGHAAAPSPSSNPYYSPHVHGNASVSAANGGAAQGYAHYQGQQPYPGQLVQYQQQQQYQQQLQHQHAQQGYRSTSLSSGPPMSSGRGGRAFSSASTAVLESKEQKLRKQFSVTWVSGSLGFSFRPYAPGVNVPTVDLIGARGEGKNMELVCVNDVLIAINGNKTKDLGVERVLKMLHVLEKPVVLRFHKSSHRIETPVTKVRRKSSAKKLMAVVEREREVEKEYEEEEEEEKEDDEGAEQAHHEEEEQRHHHHHHHHHLQQQHQEQEDEDEDDEQEVGDLEYEAMPSVRFALDDQIQLRSESRATKPQAQPADHSRAARVSARSHHSNFDEPKKEEPVAIASQFAKRIASSPKARNRATNKPQPAPVPTPAPAPVPVPVPAAPAPASSPLLYNEQDLDDDFLEPDQEVDESELPHVPISVAASTPIKRTTSSFTIPLEHAREIVAKSSGKPVAECQFGGKPLLQIQEGSVQARLLVTFAKACLAKQMKTARGENELPQKPQPPAQPSLPQPQPNYQPRASSSTSSEHRPPSVNGGLPTPKPKPLPVPAPPTINVFAGNTLAPGKPKYLAYSFRQTPSTTAPAVQERRESSTFLSLPPSAATEQAPQQQQQQPHARIFHFNENVHHNNTQAKQTSTEIETDLNEHIDQESEAKPPSPAHSETEPSQEVEQISTAPATMPERASESGRVSAGGLTMSQLRVSGKLTPHDIDMGLIEKFKDLGEVTVAEEQDDLPQRGTDMITLDSLLAMRAGESSMSGGVRRSSEATPASTSSLSHDEEEKEEEELITHKDQVLPESETIEPQMETTPAPVIVQVEESLEDKVESPKPEEKATEEKATEPKVESPRRKVPVGTIASVDHPLIHRLCADSRDLETVMVGHTVEMIINKKRVVEEIQDILDSLEMELQFERHSFVSMGQVEDFAPQAKCSRCNRSGDASEMLLDRERRELYCPNCYDVFFYQDAASSMRNSSASSMVPPEFDTPTDFDPFEYSLHDSMVNLEEEFLPWRHLNSDAPSERDSNVTLASSITSHADEVWL